MSESPLADVEVYLTRAIQALTEQVRALVAEVRALRALAGGEEVPDAGESGPGSEAEPR